MGIGKLLRYFQEIFDSFDYANDPDCYDNADDARVFVIEEKIAVDKNDKRLAKLRNVGKI